MLTLEDFRLQYPSFRSVLDAAVTKALAQAEARTDASIFRDLTDEAHGTLTASILHVNNVVGVRTSKEDQASADNWYKRRKELEGIVGGFQGGAV